MLERTIKSLSEIELGNYNRAIRNIEKERISGMYKYWPNRNPEDDIEREKKLYELKLQEMEERKSRLKRFKEEYNSLK